MSETQTSLGLPVLDISQPIKTSSLSSLSLACKEWGFFYITNHGISKELYRKLCSISNHLFKLPSELKLKLGPSSTLKTYTPHFIASPFYESLRVSGPDFFASAQSSAEEVLSLQSSEFRSNDHINMPALLPTRKQPFQFVFVALEGIMDSSKWKFC